MRVIAREQDARIDRDMVVKEFEVTVSPLQRSTTTKDLSVCDMKGILRSLSDISLRVSPLATGHSKEISGSITIEPRGSAVCDLTPKSVNFQFQALDSLINFFAIGQVTL